MLLEVDEATLDAGSAAVLSGKLLQFCNGAVYDNDKNAVEVHGEKLEAFKEIVEGSQGKPILVFYNFQHDKARIMKCLPKGLRVAEMCIRDSPPKRPEAVLPKTPDDTGREEL